LPIDEALAPFADMLRQHLPTPEEIEQTAARRQGLRRGRGRTAAAAAACAGVLAVVLWADPVLQRETLTTAVGQRQTWTLADGSQVQLNTDSRVQVAQHLRSRRLALERGEACFEVSHAFWHGWAPRLQRPFTVVAGSVVVEDIGTVFHVRRHDGDGAGEGDTEVGVLQGAVRVHAPGRGEPPVELRSGQGLRVRAGMPLPLPAPPADPAQSAGTALAWRQGRLVFDATPLSEAVADMQRYRATPIVLADTQAARLRISGQFDLERMDQLLDLLPRLAPVQVRREEGGRVVISTRHRP
jgi:transmembrane sensor